MKSSEADPPTVPDCHLYHGDCLDILRQLPTGSVDLVFTSPPYPGKLQRYGTKEKMDDNEWKDWLSRRVLEMCRVSKGMVGVVVNGRVSKGRYSPAPERLISQLAACVNVERPTIWHKNAPPNRRDWFGNDWEYILWFWKNSRGPWNWEAIATPPKFAAGGRFRQRAQNGERRLGNAYPTGKLTRPRDVHRCTVGGGHLGSKLSHANEAPFPEALVERYILALSNLGGVVLDPFIGSGTTASVALMHGRKAIGIDCRRDQCELAMRRIRSQNTADHLTFAVNY